MMARILGCDQKNGHMHCELCTNHLSGSAPVNEIVILTDALFNTRSEFYKK